MSVNISSLHVVRLGLALVCVWDRGEEGGNAVSQKPAIHSFSLIFHLKFTFIRTIFTHKFTLLLSATQLSCKTCIFRIYTRGKFEIMWLLELVASSAAAIFSSQLLTTASIFTAAPRFLFGHISRHNRETKYRKITTTKR